MNDTQIKNWKVISVGILHRDNQFLIGLRKPKDGKKNVWEFPGGSIEQGELPEDACIRELKEELGIQVKKWNLAGCLCDYKPGQFYVIIFHHILEWEGEIKNHCHQKLRWINLKESEKEKLPNINLSLFKEISSLLKKK